VPHDFPFSNLSAVLQNTPDTVYYQSYTSYNMGYKIRVMDSIPDDLQSAAPMLFDYQVWLDNNAIVKVRAPRVVELRL